MLFFIFFIPIGVCGQTKELGGSSNSNRPSSSEEVAPKIKYEACPSQLINGFYSSGVYESYDRKLSGDRGCSSFQSSGAYGEMFDILKKSDHTQVEVANLDQMQCFTGLPPARRASALVQTVHVAQSLDHGQASNLDEIAMIDSWLGGEGKPPKEICNGLDPNSRLGFSCKRMNQCPQKFDFNDMKEQFLFDADTMLKIDKEKHAKGKTCPTIPAGQGARVASPMCLDSIDKEYDERFKNEVYATSPVLADSEIRAEVFRSVNYRLAEPAQDESKLTESLKSYLRKRRDSLVSTTKDLAQQSTCVKSGKFSSDEKNVCSVKSIMKNTAEFGSYAELPPKSNETQNSPDAISFTKESIALSGAQNCAAIKIKNEESGDLKLNLTADAIIFIATLGSSSIAESARFASYARYLGLIRSARFSLSTRRLAGRVGFWLFDGAFAVKDAIRANDSCKNLSAQEKRIVETRLFPEKFGPECNGGATGSASETQMMKCIGSLAGTAAFGGRALYRGGKLISEMGESQELENLSKSFQKYFGSKIDPVTRAQIQEKLEMPDMIFREARRKVQNLLSSKTYHFDEQNTERLRNLRNLPGANGKIPEGFSQSKIREIFRNTRDNPVASICNLSKYESATGEGFCFGRAMAAHLEALKSATDASNVRKIWYVGKQGRNGDHWSFHVATALRGKNGNWYVIDPKFGKPIEVEAWYAALKFTDKTGLARIHISDPSTFVIKPDLIKASDIASTTSYLDRAKMSGGIGRFFDDLSASMKTEFEAALKAMGK